MNNSRKYFVILTLAFALTFPFYAQAQHPEFVSVSDEIKSKFDNKQKQIIQELESLQENEWAGEYWAVLGSIDGASFYWSPVSGFAVRSGNDSHRGVEKVNYGSVKFNGNLLTLSPEYLEKNKHTFAVSKSFVPIRWDKRHWLIPSDKLILFIYAVNSGDYDEINSFFVKYEDIQKPSEGLPDVLKEYRKYLNRKPIKAKAINVNLNNSAYFWDHTIKLNVGKTDGVIEEMKFYLINVKDVTTTIEITDVAEHTSTARILSIGSSGSSNKETKPSIGWRFSSKLQPLH